MLTVADIISSWGTMQSLADDLGEQYVTVANWKWRKSIPSKYWLRIVEAAKARDLHNITLEALAIAHAEPAHKEAVANG